MYLHIGNEIIVNKQSIIGIFDIENTSVSKFTKDYFRIKQKEGKVVTVTEEIPKSFVICEQKGKENIYLTQLATATLKKRSEKGEINR